MMLSLFVTAASALGALPPGAPASAAPVVQDDAKAALIAEWEKKMAAAGRDVEKLFGIADWCKENKLRDQQRDTYKRVLELDSENEAAHKALRHHNYDGKWFETYAELSVYKRDEAKRLEEQGLTIINGEKVPIVDAPFVRMGWVKGEDGKYHSPGELARIEREEKLVADGWQQQYLVWVPPDDFEKWRSGLWKCGDDWLELEQADAYHANVQTPWIIPGDHFTVYTTLDHESARWAVWWADQAFADLVRLYGLQPEGRPRVTVLSSLDQYNKYAAGDPEAGMPQVEANGYSSCHYSFFAELQFRGEPGAGDGAAPVIIPDQGGVGYWDQNDAKMAAFGQYSVRHAAGLTYVEAIDPSWDAVSRVVANPGGGQFPEAAFWEEKRIPRWLRYGGASYVERYLQDPTSETPWANRAWAIGNLMNKGELDPFEAIFALQLDPADTSGKLIGEAGLLVSFILDGGCKPVQDAHAKLKAMLRRGADTKEAVAELQQALVDNEKALQAFIKGA